MWEKPRIDNTKKLKFNAVPTIFGDLVIQIQGKASNGLKYLKYDYNHKM